MSIRLRFTLALTGVGVVLFGTYALWAYWSEREDLDASAAREMRIVGQSLETSLGNALRDRRHGDIEETLSALVALAPNVDIHLHDPAGGGIAHSHDAKVDPTVESLATRAAVSRTELVTFDPPEYPRRLIFSGPLTADDGTVLGSVTVSRPADDLTEDLERTRNRLLLALGAFVVATMVAGMLLGTVHVSRPLARLLGGIRQVREGDFRARVEKSRDDEIGELVAEFNAMIAALEHARAQTETESEARERLEQGLQRVDKLVTIGQLSAGLAHEIGSPLQVLAGRAATLTEHSDPEVRRQAALLVTQCDRITRVVEQLLSFGRRKPALIGRCDLVEPVTSVIDLLAAEARRRSVTLRLDVDKGPYLITGDVDQLQQVALNLLRNALHATPSGGAITVRIAHGQGGVLLSVRDTGPGIDEATRARLFEPFFTTRASDGGTGLGLAVVRAIVQEHGAAIDVHSEPGTGAEFVVTFKEADHG